MVLDLQTRLMSIGIYFFSGTMLCVFLRGVGIVGAAPISQEVEVVDLQGHESCHEKELDVHV